MGAGVKGYTLLLVGVIILAAFSLRMEAFLTFPCPPGSDPGLRVKNAFLLSREWVNITYPAFDATLSLLWISTGRSTRGLISTTELFVSVVMAFCAASMYIASIHVFEDRKASLVAALLAAFSAPTYELISFGSYPQGLSLFLIPLIFATALNRRLRSGLPQALCLGGLGASLLMMHFWSFAICTITILLFSVADYTLSTFRKRGRPCSAGKVLIMAPLLALLFSSPWWAPILPFLRKTLLYAPVGATSIRGVGWRFTRFFSPYWLYYVFLPAGLLGFYTRRRHRDLEGLILVGSWFLTPFILMQGYRFGVGADYRRLWYYPMEPAMILVGLGLGFALSLILHAIREATKHGFREEGVLRAAHRRRVLVFPVILILATLLFSPGWWAIREANASTRYYSHVREPELGMILWIGGHVEEGMEILSSGSVGWWIRGLAGRHVISVIPRAFINVPWQISRAESLGILVSEASYAMRNGLIQVRDSGPYWSGFNPELSVKLGDEYRSLMHLNDTGIVLRLSNGRRIALAGMQERESAWISRGDDTGALRTRYSGGAATVIKTIKLGCSSSLADIELEINGVRADIQGLSIVGYPDEDRRYSVILAEGIEQRIGEENIYYLTPRSRWFAIYDEEDDLCLVVRLERESRVRFRVEGGSLLSFELDLEVEGGRASMGIGGFLVEDRSRLRESVEQYLLDGEGGSGLGDAAGRVSTLDYLEVLREYRIRIIVIGTVEKHARDPHLNLVFSTGEKFIFESP